ncbi:uncharacterized protein LOC131265738 isoform X2 [Anopheles coustani]|uniref:uncharacterized protein LOC131265738 isoform X2 n=1 Tax=Anopheles coustani TaxID=139045 RepID=UPI002658B619|nr:uncharacterized protein LOC131265738 isoform X2 [Anopheles coustani]
MASKDAGPRDESELESAWDLLDNDSDIGSDGAEEAEEGAVISDDGEGESPEKDGNADAMVAEEHTGNDGEAVEESKTSKEKKKKKGKAARVVKGFKKFVGGVFRPSGSKLKWDVDANVSLRATYDSNGADSSAEPVPKKEPIVAPPKKPPADRSPRKSQKPVARPKKPPDEEDGEIAGPSMSVEDARLAALTAENEELRQRCKRTTSEPTSRFASVLSTHTC